MLVVAVVAAAAVPAPHVRPTMTEPSNKELTTTLPMAHVKREKVRQMVGWYMRVSLRGGRGIR